MREADSAFGDPTMFLEQAVRRAASHRGADPRRRDGDACTCSSATARCSAGTRRSSRSRRRRTSTTTCASALHARRHRVRAVDRLRQRGHGRVPARHRRRAGRQHVFIEMNPRIQVEHTVTEEVTDVDLVQSQMRIAARETLAELGLTQDKIQMRGAALQCRITTEDPANGLPPRHRQDHHLPLAGRRRHPPRRRHDQPGRQISPHFDSMLAKLTCRGRDFAGRGGARPARAGRVPHPRRRRPTSRSCRRCSTTPTSSPGDVSTSFIEERPELLRAADAEGPRHQDADLARRRHRQPAQRRRRAAPSTPPPSCRSTCRARRPPARASGCSSSARRASPHALRAQTPLAVTDTTFRDAHQSLLATRVRTRDLLAVAPYVARLTPELLSRRGLGRRDLRRGAPLPRRGPVGAARRPARGAAEPLPADAAARPQHRRLHAVPDRGDRRLRRARPPRTGVDIFRIFDALNDVDADAPGDRRGARDRHRGRRGGRSATPATCSTRPRRSTRSTTTCGSPSRSSRPARTSSPSRTWPGLLRPPPPRKLVAALRERFDLPVHLHTHDTAGGQLATLLAAIDAGRRRGRRRAARRWRAPPASRRASALVAALAHTERDTGISLRRSPTSSRTGRPCATSTAVRVGPARPRQAASTSTRSPAASSRTCASRRSRSASPTTSS